MEGKDGGIDPLHQLVPGSNEGGDLVRVPQNAVDGAHGSSVLRNKPTSLIMFVSVFESVHLISLIRCTYIVYVFYNHH